MSTSDSMLSYSPPPTSILRFKGFQRKSSGPFCCPIPNCSGKVISNEAGIDGIKEHGRQCSEEKVRVALHLKAQKGVETHHANKISGPQTLGGVLLARLVLTPQGLPRYSRQRSVNTPNVHSV